MTLVTHRRHDEEVAGPRGGDVEDARRLLALARHLLGRVRDQLGWQAAGELQGTELPLGVHPARGLRCRRVGGEITEHDHRELESLRAVDRHDADALRPFLDDGGIARLAVGCLLGEVLDEGAE